MKKAERGPSSFQPSLDTGFQPKAHSSSQVLTPFKQAVYDEADAIIKKRKKEWVKNNAKEAKECGAWFKEEIPAAVWEEFKSEGLLPTDVPTPA